MTIDPRTLAASRVLYGISVVLAFMGMLYVFSPRIMPYHERFIGMKHEQLESKVAFLLLLMMKGVGINFLATAAALGMLARVPFRRREPWAWWTVLVVGSIALVPLLWITLTVGFFAPWWLVSLGIVALFVALALWGLPR